MRILIAPQSAAADALLDRLVTWSAAGLLEPFCWWEAGGEDADALLTVARVEAGECTSIPLHDALDAPGELAILAVVPTEAGGTLSVDEFEQAVGRRLEAAAEVRVFRPGEATTATLIVLPGEIGGSVDPGLFAPTWNANIYVAPEDRADANAANALKGNPTGVPAHGAHALCVLGDLWSRPVDPAGSTISRLGELSTGPDRSDVCVVRCYSRAVDFGYLASHLAAEVFQVGDGWPNPDPAHLDRRQDVKELVDYVVQQFLRKHHEALGLSELDLIPLPEPRELTLWQAIKELFAGLLLRLRDKPVEMIQDAIYEVYNRAADRVERAGGADRDWRVKRPDRGNAQLSDLSDLADELEKPVIVPDGPVEAAWRDLRLLTVGLIDGSELPRGLEEEILIQNNKRAVITHPEAIVPDPAIRPPRSQELPDPRACDPRALDPRFSPPADGEWDGEEGAPAPPLDRAFWSEGRADTPVWEIGAAIVATIAEAERVAQTSVPTPEERRATQEKLAAQDKADRRRDRRQARWSFLGATLLAILAGAEAWTQLGWAARIPFLLVIVVLWFVVLARIARRIIRRRERSALDAIRQEVEALNAAIARSVRSGDRIRLSRRYREYLDWAEILGWFAHHPWVGEPLRRVPVQPSVEPDGLPAALRVANARTRERLPVLGAQAQGKIFRAGWLSGLYDAIEADLMSALAELRGFGRGASAADRPAPAADLDQDPQGARTYFAASVRDGVGRHLSENPLSDSLLKILDGVPVQAASDGVVVLDDATAAKNPDLRPLTPSLAWFSKPEGLDELLDLRRPAVVRISARNHAGESWGGTGVVIEADGAVATARHVVEGASELTVDFISGAPVPATLRRVAEHTDLALITITGGGTLSPAPLAAADALKQGDPVVALGHPLLQEGEPSFAWGLITATDRRIRMNDAPPGVGEIDVIQADYNSAGGSSGEPVFNLDGAVVGIHVGGTHVQGSGVPDNLASAVPVAELHRLLDQSETARPEADAATKSPAPGGRAGTFPTVGAFLGELAGQADGISLLHQHWRDPSRGTHLVRMVLRTGARDDATATLSELAGPAEFFRPLRAVASRIEVAGRTNPLALRSCDGSDRREPDDDDPDDTGELG